VLLKPGQPRVAALSAAVPGSTIHRISARRIATGTPPITGTTTWVSGSDARLSPEPARSRSRRARTKRPGLPMMSMVGTGIAPDTTAALVLAHSWGDRRRRLVGRHAEKSASSPAGSQLSFVRPEQATATNNLAAGNLTLLPGRKTSLRTKVFSNFPTCTARRAVVGVAGMVIWTCSRRAEQFRQSGFQPL
jgi:hypothetical protein